MHHKVSQIETKVNYIQIVLVIILVVMCTISSVGYSILHTVNHLRAGNSYIPQVYLNFSV